MDHKFVQDNNIIERYLLMELTPDEETAFEEHLIMCSECRKELQVMEDTIVGIGEFISSKLKNNFVSEKKKEKQSKIIGLSILKIVASLVVIAGIYAIVVLIFKNRASLNQLSENNTEKSDSFKHEHSSKYNTIDSTNDQTISIEEKQEYLTESFKVNPFYENLVENYYRNEGLEIISPIDDTLYTLPVFSWKSIDSKSLTLLVINNKDVKLFKRQIKSGFNYEKHLQPGLYYWQLQNKEETLFTGKFVFYPFSGQ